MIDGLAVARAVHVVAIVHWIGGLLFVTLVILPSLLETEAPRRLAVFDALERRFATQARLSTLLVGLSGFYMLYAYEHLNRKRKWLFNTVRELSEFSANALVVPRFMTGSKIPYRGRRLSLTVRRHDGPHVEITFRNGFIVDLPSWVALESADAIVAQEIKQWLKQRVRRDVREIAELYIDRFGLKPRSIHVAEFITGWGSCGPKGTVNIDWRLVFAPKKVLEYVVVHELAHLRHRSHGKRFWNYLEQIMPAYCQSRAWLDAHQATLEGAFLYRFSEAATAHQTAIKASSFGDRSGDHHVRGPKTRN